MKPLPAPALDREKTLEGRFSSFLHLEGEPETRRAPDRLRETPAETCRSPGKESLDSVFEARDEAASAPPALESVSTQERAGERFPERRILREPGRETSAPVRLALEDAAEELDCGLGVAPHERAGEAPHRFEGMEPRRAPGQGRVGTVRRPGFAAPLRGSGGAPPEESRSGWSRTDRR